MTAIQCCEVGIALMRQFAEGTEATAIRVVLEHDAQCEQCQRAILEHSGPYWGSRWLQAAARARLERHLPRGATGEG